MTAQTRIYIVSPTVPLASGSDQRRLVRAGNSAQALRHVVEHTLQVSLASQADLVELVGAGVKVEDLKAETPTE